MAFVQFNAFVHGGGLPPVGSVNANNVGGHGLERIAGGGHGAFDVFGGMGGGDEGGLELRWREKNSAVEHFSEEAGIPLGVRALGADVVADWLGGEEESTEGAGGVDLGEDSGISEGLAKSAG